MAAVPTTVTQAVITGELPAITAWADRHPLWSVTVEPEARRLTADTPHPVSGTALRITADLDGYPGLPPLWQFVDPATGQSVPQAFPLGGAPPGINGTIFHSNRVICAPWSRLAYGEHGGPHNDWGGLASWKNAAPTYTKADTLADMLDQIALHLSASPGTHP